MHEGGVERSAVPEHCCVLGAVLCRIQENCRAAGRAMLLSRNGVCLWCAPVEEMPHEVSYADTLVFSSRPFNVGLFIVRPLE